MHEADLLNLLTGSVITHSGFETCVCYEIYDTGVYPLLDPDE